MKTRLTHVMSLVPISPVDNTSSTLTTCSRRNDSSRAAGASELRRSTNRPQTILSNECVIQRRVDELQPCSTRAAATVIAETHATGNRTVSRLLHLYMSSVPSQTATTIRSRSSVRPPHPERPHPSQEARTRDARKAANIAPSPRPRSKPSQRVINNVGETYSVSSVHPVNSSGIHVLPKYICSKCRDV